MIYWNDDSGSVIHHADCISVMECINDNDIDLVILDPPYNISKPGDVISRTDNGTYRSTDIKLDYGSWDRMPDDEYREFIDTVMYHVNRVLKPKSWGYVFFDSKKLGMLESAYSKYGMHYQALITWCKVNPVPSFRKYTWVSATEHISAFSIGKSRIPNFLSPQKEMYMWQFTSNKGGYGVTKHPNEKPVSLVEKLITSSSNRHDTVLDVFVGSGTTAVACAATDRKFVVADTDLQWCQVTADRVSAEMAQLKLMI